MKKYIEPQITIIRYTLSDIIAVSQPNSNTSGAETGNEFSVSSDNGYPETSIPDLITPSGNDEWW